MNKTEKKKQIGRKAKQIMHAEEKSYTHQRGGIREKSLSGALVMIQSTKVQLYIFPTPVVKRGILSYELSDLDRETIAVLRLGRGTIDRTISFSLSNYPKEFYRQTPRAWA